MRRFAFGLLAFVTSIAATNGCAPRDDDGATAADSALISFSPGPFANADSIAFGETKALTVPSAGTAVLKFTAQANDAITIKVSDDETFRKPRTFLAERRSDGTYAAVLGSPLSATDGIQLRLGKTQTYFIVVRDADGLSGSKFAVHLERETLCPGAPHTFTAAELAEHIPAGFDSFTIEGRFDTPSATNTRAVVVHVGETVPSFENVVPGMKVDLANAKVVASDPALVAQTHLEVTASCVAIDTGTTRFVGWLPAGSPHPPAQAPKLPPFACESEAALTDDAMVLDHVPAGATEAKATTAAQVWTEWRCTDLTGCTQRQGTADDTVGGYVGIDTSTQDVYVRLAHKHGNLPDPEAKLSVTNGTFTWGNYQGRLTKHWVVLTSTEPESATENGVQVTGEYRAGYCLPW